MLIFVVTGSESIFFTHPPEFHPTGIPGNTNTTKIYTVIKNSLRHLNSWTSGLRRQSECGHRQNHRIGRVARDLRGHQLPSPHQGQGCHPLYQVPSFVISCWLAEVLPLLCAAFLWLSLENAWFIPKGTWGAQPSNWGCWVPHGRAHKHCGKFKMKTYDLEINLTEIQLLHL